MFFCIYIFGYPIQAQGGYVRQINTTELRSFDVDGVSLDEGKIFVSGNVFIDSLSLWGLYVASLDTFGSVLDVRIVSDSVGHNNYYAVTPQGLVVTPDKFIFAFNILGASEVALGVWDRVIGTFVRIIIPYDGVVMLPKHIYCMDDRIYLVGTVQRSNLRLDNFVCCLTLSGKINWIKYYGLWEFDEYCSNAYINSDKTITLPSTRMTKEYSQNTEKIVGWREPWMITIDTAGNIVSQWLGLNNDQRSLGGGCGMQTADKDWILTSADPKVVPYFEKTIIYYSPTITCFDSAYHLKWKLSLTDYTSRLDELVDLEYNSLDNTYVASGKRYVQYDPLPDESEIWALKFNADGEILWNITDTLFYHRRELHYTAGHVIAPSGSIYVAGWVDLFQQEQRYTGFIMKLTPDGCTDTLCSTTSLQAQMDQFGQDVVIYPNPAVDRLYVELKQGFKHPELIISSIDGKSLLSRTLSRGQNEVPLDIGPGIYVCSVASQEGILKTTKLVITR